MERDQLHSSSTQFVHVSDLGVNESQDGLFSVSVLNTLTSLDKDALPPVRTFQSEANKPMSERVTRWEDASASLTSPEVSSLNRMILILIAFCGFIVGEYDALDIYPYALPPLLTPCSICKCSSTTSFAWPFKVSQVSVQMD